MNSEFCAFEKLFKIPEIIVENGCCFCPKMRIHSEILFVICKIDQINDRLFRNFRFVWFVSMKFIRSFTMNRQLSAKERKSVFSIKKFKINPHNTQVFFFKIRYFDQHTAFSECLCLMGVKFQWIKFQFNSVHSHDFKIAVEFIQSINLRTSPKRLNEYRQIQSFH